MARYAGINEKSIQIVSDVFFVHSKLYMVEIPLDLNKISDQDIILNYEYYDNKFINKYNKKANKDLKIAFITNWKMKCGISSYSEKIISEIIPHIYDFKLFIEHNNNPIEKINLIQHKEIPLDKIIECWSRGESLLNLVDEIKKYNPDVIIIQHEFGIFPDGKYFLSMLTQLSNYKIITVLHSTFPEHFDKLIIEAALTNVIIHLDGAKEILKNTKHISSKIFVIPHGCDQIESKTRLWNYYKSDHTFMQSGFSFKYKNFQTAIEATYLLKFKYPDVFFTALLSETDFNQIEHQLYYNELFSLIQKLNIMDNVALIRGYQSDVVMDAYYRTNKIAVFPYKSHPGHLVFGASGSCRTAFSKQIPVISSSIPHFSDVPTIKSDNSEELALELDRLFANPALQQAQIIKQNKYIEENSWSNVAQKYLKAFEDL